MASFHHSIKNGKRGTATEHRLYNTRGGKKYEDRGDLMHTSHRNFPDDDPGAFWKAADKHERANGAAYREHEIALPADLAISQQIDLAKQLADRLVGGKPHEIAIHCPNSSIEGVPNPHVHIMYSDRISDGLDRPVAQIFRRPSSQHPERGGWKKDSGGKDRRQMHDIAHSRREVVAKTINEALENAGLEDRVDHRSLKAQGVDRQPERHLGPAAIQAMTTEERVRHVTNRPKQT
jgi:hypothetical protein